MIYIGIKSTKRVCCGVAILTDREWEEHMKEYNFINERLY